MKEVGETQDSLSAKLGMSQGGLQHWLAGTRQPALEDINRIAQLLECSPVWLTHGVGAVTQSQTLALPAPGSETAQPGDAPEAVVLDLRHHQRPDAYWPFKVSPERVKAALGPEHIALIEAHIIGLVQACEMQSQAARRRNSRSAANGQH